MQIRRSGFWWKPTLQLKHFHVVTPILPWYVLEMKTPTCEDCAQRTSLDLASTKYLRGRWQLSYRKYCGMWVKGECNKSSSTCCFVEILWSYQDRRPLAFVAVSAETTRNQQVVLLQIWVPGCMGLCVWCCRETFRWFAHIHTRYRNQIVLTAEKNFEIYTIPRRQSRSRLDPAKARDRLRR